MEILKNLKSALKGFSKFPIQSSFPISTISPINGICLTVFQKDHHSKTIYIKKTVVTLPPKLHDLKKLQYNEKTTKRENPVT